MLNKEMYWEVKELLRNTKGEMSAGAYLTLDYVFKYLNFEK
jgi:hypothetical protein